jgi:hypothetical protein
MHQTPPAFLLSNTLRKGTEHDRGPTISDSQNTGLPDPPCPGVSEKGVAATKPEPPMDAPTVQLDSPQIKVRLRGSM